MTLDVDTTTFEVSVVEESAEISIVEDTFDVVEVSLQGPPGPVGPAGVDGVDGVDGQPVQRFALTIGDGVESSFSVVHGFDSRDVIVFVTEVASGIQVHVATTIVDENTILLEFASVPSLNEFNVVVVY